jgi:hypothetical protein
MEQNENITSRLELLKRISKWYAFQKWWADEYIKHKHLGGIKALLLELRRHQ